MNIVLNGIQNFLQFINDNWTAIIVVIGLMIAVYQKIVNYLRLSNEEKINIAKKHIEEVVLKLVTDAEEEYQEWVKAGAVKRAQVIEKIFMMYPILFKAVDQDELVNWIDKTIDNALEIMRNIISENNNVDNSMQSVD